MTREEINQRMIASVQATLESKLDDLDVLEEINEDDVDEYIWSMNYGTCIAEDYIEENLDDLKNGILESIWDEIDSSDLESPF